jgi:hypothetical protein
MKSVAVLGRVAAGAAGAALLVGVAGAAAFAADVPYGDDDVPVNVAIDETAEPGELSLTVSGSVTLTEALGQLTDTTRTFTGSLPTVTVTDSRVFPERLDPGAYWYVLGSSSAFLGDASQPSIDPANLGWTPELRGPTDPGEVIAGDPVDPALDPGPDNVGLVNRELLAAAVTSQGNTPPGSWTVGADLKLKTPITVAPGTYTAHLTLSLFEDIDG